MSGNGFLIFLILISILIGWFFWIRLPAQMARERGRSPLLWIIIFWCLSPIWGAVILLIAGDSADKEDE